MFFFSVSKLLPVMQRVPGIQIVVKGAKNGKRSKEGKEKWLLGRNYYKCIWLQMKRIEMGLKHVNFPGSFKKTVASYDLQVSPDLIQNLLAFLALY